MTTLVLLMALGVAGGLGASPVQAASLEFVPASQSVRIGHPAQVAIRVSDVGDSAAPSLAVFDVVVTFDPALLSFSGVTYGDPGLGNQLDLLGLGSVGDHSRSGLRHPVRVALDPAGDLNALQAGAFALATLAFDTLAVGTSLLGLTVNALGDADGNLLIPDAVGTGAIAVTPQAVPAPGALLLLGGALAALGLRGRR